MTIVATFQRRRMGDSSPKKAAPSAHRHRSLKSFLHSKPIPDTITSSNRVNSTVYHHPQHRYAPQRYKLHPIFSLPEHVIQYQPPKKRVRFAPTATVTPIQRDEKDLHNAWYKENHYRYFEAANKKSVEMYRLGEIMEQNSGNNNNNTTTCMGLEQYLDGKHHVRRTKLLRHCAVVLEIYRAQRDFGIFDAHMVREISERFSKSFVSDARARAVLHKRDAHGK